MLMVADDPVGVEAELKAGRLSCPACGGRLAPWGWGRRRWLRTLQGTRRLRVRRACCRSCRATHLLLPTSALVRRLDAVEVVGAALLANVAGQGRRSIAAHLHVPPSTVRNWLRRAGAEAERIRSEATRWAAHANPQLERIEPQGSPLADALHALGLAADALTRRLGLPYSAWHVVSAITAGRLLSHCPP